MLDDNYVPIGRDVSVIDIPIVTEVSYDYDEMKGVVDDWANPYDKTEQIEVYISPKSKTVLESLGNQCKICTDRDSKLLSVRRIHVSRKIESQKHLKELVEEMVMKGEDPTKEFCIICQNCIMKVKKMSNDLKSMGLSKYTVDDLERVFT